MNTSNKVFLAAIILCLVALAYMPELPPTEIKTGHFTVFHVDPPIYDYLSLPLFLLICSVGLLIAGLKLRKE